MTIRRNQYYKKSNHHKNRKGKIVILISLLVLNLFITKIAAKNNLNIEILKSSSAANIKIMYRGLYPGEPLFINIDWPQDLSEIKISFLGDSFMHKSSADNQSVIACFGIDVLTNPGDYPLEITMFKKDISKEKLTWTARVLPKSFPVKKITVKQEYVTPPKEALDRIERENELVNSIYSQVTPVWLGDGAFVLPSLFESWGNFGQRRLTNNVLSSVHTGLDFKVPFGEPILAANAGLVVLASDLYMSGKTVIIDHGLGIFSNYGHLSRMLVKRGQKVNKGQVVGECGSTGRSTGPHLHWGIRIRNSRLDPEAFLLLPFPSVPASKTSR